jgi:hypothetical protein
MQLLTDSEIEFSVYLPNVKMLFVIKSASMAVLKKRRAQHMTATSDGKRELHQV